MVPVIAVDGIVARICKSDQLFTVRAVLLSLIVLVPWLVPNPLPLICTCVPTGALEGTTAATIGFGTVKTTSGLLAMPFTDTKIGPVLVFVGIVATICVSLQLTTVALKPLNVIPEDPLVA